MLTGTRRFPAGIVSLVLLLLVAAHTASAQIALFPKCENPAGSPPLGQYNICEVVIPQSTYVPTTNPACDIECAKERAYTEPDVKAVFTHTADNRKRTVHAFYEINPATQQIEFRVRFNMSEAGDWGYEIKCTMQSDDTVPCPVTGASKSFT